MKIVDLNGKYVLLSIMGHILHTEHDYPAMQAYCKNNFAASYKSIQEDFSHPLYDTEHETYTTERALEIEYNSDAEKQEEYGTFRNWMREITGKNGTMKWL